MKATPKEPPGLFARLMFLWTFPYFYNGNRRDLEEEDLVPTTPDYHSRTVGDKLERNWLIEEANAKATGRKPSLVTALTRTFFWSFIPGGISQLLSVGIRTAIPLLFAELLSYWSVNSTTSKSTAAYYAIGMILGNWVAAFFGHHGNFLCQQFGMKLRVAISSLMFRKIMRMNNGALGETTAGKVVNLLSNDLQRFDLAFLFLHYIWIIPLQLAAVCYLGYMQAGYAALIGLAALLILALPIQGLLGKILGKFRFRTAVKTDARVKLMSEVINGIQVIKMYAWEIPFEKVVSEKRREELKQIRIASALRVIFLGFMVFTERAALFITVLALVLFGNVMTANVIYPLQQFLNTAQINVTLILPLVLTFTIELFVSLRRVEEFLALEDRVDLIKTEMATPTLFRNISGSFRDEGKESSVRPLSYQTKSELMSDQFSSNGFVPTGRKFRRSLSQPNYDLAVELRDVSASWTGDPNFLALKNISVRIRKGKFCAIIGAVGSGKSSILQLLLKELPAATGSVSVFGNVSYASQEAWLFPSTVRENILFGKPFDKQKYQHVCRVCALEKDFKQFPYGDQTLVGERGVSLWGGQRARINLARAVYRQADIYFLDDPLSAVDANVGRQLFDGCINGYLRGTTRILVTHQIHFLKAADFIIVMSEGGIENMGTFDELVSSGKDFAMLLSALQEGKEKDADSTSLTKTDEKARPALLKAISINEGDEQAQFEEQKMAAEERQSGNLRWEVVSTYFKAGGNIFFVIFTFFMVLMTAVSAGVVDYWVSYWTNQMAAYEEEVGADMEPGLDVQVGPLTTGQYLIIHGCLVLVTILITNFRAIPFVQLCMNASKWLHDTMFSTMLRGIMRFFDTSSSGRILNRFTKDIGAVDEILPRTLLDVLQIYGTLIIILILNAIALYWTLVPSAVLLVLFLFFVRIYTKAAQGVKRLESVTKSPVFGMVTSSLNGIATIRCCGAQDRLIVDFDEHQDLHSSAWYGYLGGGVTFGFYLDTMCLIYMTTIIFVFIYIDFGNIIAVGSVGLAVTQSNTLTAMLQHGARMLVEYVAQLTSVERVLDYTKVETERNLFDGRAFGVLGYSELVFKLKGLNMKALILGQGRSCPIPPTWPAEGRVVFQNVSLRYAPDEAPVLKNLNLEIESGWKVGIVGRTGAGKSSLISALFRFSYIDGKISIDGIDTAMIAKQGLRSKISIIPQEPVLFSATIRYNLDPFNIYSDDDLWRALEQVDMKSAIPSLDFKVTEGGANFSVGQRQLMCLARAVLRSNKILIMDEATANVDPQTDNFIQQTIRRQFASCTVLTIAHRLNTIMDSDRVLVMSSGCIAEFDHPYILLSDPNSAFSSMVRETGEKNSRQLFEVAKEAYSQNNLKQNSR
ncbi:putative multidrug resistance-associated protein lethal(2)03659 [Papilio xuthus]|uniref:Putative multidrug resistance-associated protein lethal(2)03659 n=1 Tax=Papilio xuthus TaxID=66420 RepID=A0A194PJ23_PAPXU|nr:putative multidrug resistance-associated protein lethal(2)03659 [Papilio xuthus]